MLMKGNLLRCYVGKDIQKKWDLTLAHIEFIYYRSTIQTTGCSPFKVVYGKNPTSPLDSAPPPTTHHFNGDTKERAQSIRKLHRQV